MKQKSVILRRFLNVTTPIDVNFTVHNGRNVNGQDRKHNAYLIYGLPITDFVKHKSQATRPLFSFPLYCLRNTTIVLKLGKTVSI